MIWNRLKDKKPIAYESGCFDGLRTDLILVGTMRHKIHVARMYEGILDGSEFQCFYDEDDFMIENVVWWTGIDTPF